ncbi:hypothetical protein Rcae01_02752 [Novipirellula caenicola]|uniref:Uncharacterized protein n=1 Tax=Novipirellula caenicola TaxID=1536901 RepID=A0ABP9VQ85_9BACT
MTGLGDLVNSPFVKAYRTGIFSKIHYVKCFSNRSDAPCDPQRSNQRQWLIHPHADGQQDVGVALLVGGLNRQHVIIRGNRFVERPFVDGLNF